MDRPAQHHIAFDAASPEEAAALVAAVEQFLRDHAPAPASGGPAGPTPWVRAALTEGVTRAPDSRPFWA